MAAGRSWATTQAKAPVWSTATTKTPNQERIHGPMPSQSDTWGFMSPYSVVRTTYMFRNVASEAAMYAQRQRHEAATSSAVSPKNGKR